MTDFCVPVCGKDCFTWFFKILVNVVVCGAFSVVCFCVSVVDELVVVTSWLVTVVVFWLVPVVTSLVFSGSSGNLQCCFEYTRV